MSSPSPLHRLATPNFHERFKRKQSESFLSQSEYSRHRTLWTQYLHLGVFLWKQYILSTFLISCEVQTTYSKTLKYSEQYIRDHLSGTKVRIWIYSEYDAVFNFSCIASCNLTKSFLFHIIFIIRIRLWIFQTVKMYFACFWNIAL